MKILVLSHFYTPHVGGVERHAHSINRILKDKHKSEVTVITEKFDKSLKEYEEIDRVRVFRFSYPHKKYKGLLAIWKWIWQHKNLIKDADIIQIHDVFIWYLPFRFAYWRKRVVTTMHGWEGVYPIQFKNMLIKKVTNLLSTKIIAVGAYIEKYYGIRAHKIIYGAADEKLTTVKLETKVKNYLVFLGRLEKDTGIGKFLDWLKTHGDYQVDFIGDGNFKNKCSNYGRVLGFVDPEPFLEKAEICVPTGYLSYIEAKKKNCKIITFADNPLKEDYWEDIKKIKKFPTWEKLANEYISLYNSIK